MVRRCIAAPALATVVDLFLSKTTRELCGANAHKCYQRIILYRILMPFRHFIFSILIFSKYSAILQKFSNCKRFFQKNLQCPQQPPLLVQNRNTLVGIVSGGVDCKNGYPSWFTKVAFFRYVQKSQGKLFIIHTACQYSVLCRYIKISCLISQDFEVYAHFVCNIDVEGGGGEGGGEGVKTEIKFRFRYLL
jgi:hypothetical protein